MLFIHLYLHTFCFNAPCTQTPPPQNSSRRWTDLMIAAHKCKHCSIRVCARTKWQPRNRNVTPFIGALQLPTGAPTSYRSASSPKMNKSLQRSQQLWQLLLQKLPASWNRHLFLLNGSRSAFINITQTFFFNLCKLLQKNMCGSRKKLSLTRKRDSNLKSPKA